MKDEKEPWISVGERLPDTDREVETTGPIATMPDRLINGQWIYRQFRPTHWREIAKPEPAVVNTMKDALRATEAKVVSPSKALMLKWNKITGCHLSKETGDELAQATIDAFLASRTEGPTDEKINGCIEVSAIGNTLYFGETPNSVRKLYAPVLAAKDAEIEKLNGILSIERQRGDKFVTAFGNANQEIATLKAFLALKVDTAAT